MGGCGVTPARRVNPKTKPFEIPTLHHCQHCPLPAGAWHGPSTPPARPLPTPAVSIWGGGQKGIVPKGTALFSVTAALGWDGDRPQALLGRGEEGGDRGDGSTRVSVSRGGTCPIGVPLCCRPSERMQRGDGGQLPIVPRVKPRQGTWPLPAQPGWGSLGLASCLSFPLLREASLCPLSGLMGARGPL